MLVLCLRVSIFTSISFFVCFSYMEPGSFESLCCLVAKSCQTLLQPHGLYAARQAPLSMGFPRQEHWSGLPFPSPGIFLTQGLNLGLQHCRQILYHLSHQGSPEIQSDLLVNMQMMDFLVNASRRVLLQNTLGRLYLICFLWLLVNKSWNLWMYSVHACVLLP